MASTGPSKKRPAFSSFFASRNKKKAKNDDASGNSTKASKTAAEHAEKASPPLKVFVDLDGVLVDFDTGVENLTGRPPSALSSGILWSSIANADHFYRSLPWMPDGEELWEAVRLLRPSILTGVPMRNVEQASRDKYAWCKRELCVETAHWSKAGPKFSHASISKRDARNTQAWCKVITCWSRNKHLESGPGRLLIDDRLSLRDAWEEAGGVFVHHVNTERTLRTLREMNILPPLTETNVKQANSSCSAGDTAANKQATSPATENNTEKPWESTGKGTDASKITAEKDSPKITKLEAETSSSDPLSSAEAERSFSEKQVLEKKEVPAVGSSN